MRKAYCYTVGCMLNSYGIITDALSSYGLTPARTPGLVDIYIAENVPFFQLQFW